MDQDRISQQDKTQVRNELASIQRKEHENTVNENMNKIRMLKQEMADKASLEAEILKKKQKIEAYREKGDEYMCALELSHADPKRSLRILDL